ncbi:uncharacterized protein LDX57_004391 [Aspergillus melleus]|uniref:uncharacterized protein n=1 Tax=Aspergillus melleus TaxID=138277 RepID=UPI001E8E75D7|nr:uncharacterized protein LDX57_004391 [Aspergillus melleus]KAH8426657.1 hypothetical protein LDX57_004391 [Aspergillus melleus]
MQTTCLITGPGWAQAGIYLTLYIVIKQIGRHVSPFPPKTYLAICFCIDVTCLTTQAVGGGLAGAAYNNNTSTQPGTTTMVVGIITQLAAAVLFSLLVGFVMYRGAKELRENHPLFFMTSATAFATMMMIMRNVYRAIELTEGWRGYLITHEKYVLALDALPMVLAMGIYVIFNPGAQFETRGMTERQEVGEHDLARKNPVQRYLNF